MKNTLLFVIAFIAISCMSEQEKVEKAVKDYYLELELEGYSPLDFGRIREDNYKIWYNDSVQELSRIIMGLEWTIKHNAVFPSIAGRDTALTRLTTDDDKRYYLIMLRNKIDDLELTINKIDTVQVGYKVLHRYIFGSEVQNDFFVDKNYKAIMLPNAEIKENIINLVNEIDSKRNDLHDRLMLLRLNEQ